MATTDPPVVSIEHSAEWSSELELQLNKSSLNNVDEYTVVFHPAAKETSVFEPFSFPQRVLALFSREPSEKGPKAEAVSIQLLQSSSKYH